MKELEEDMIKVVWDSRISSDPEAGGKAAFEVAKKYIEKAFDHGVHWRERYCKFGGASDKDYEEHWGEAREKWLKENGIV